jgi:hypothetical protein
VAFDSLQKRSADICERPVIVVGTWVKIASVVDEELLDAESVDDPERFLRELRGSGLAADILTFAQRVPDVQPRYQYRLEWDNFAAIPISSYANWEKRVEPDVRKAVKRAKREGIVVRLAEYDDAFVHGICRIYNEAPVRQGRAFTHYQKDFEVVKKENSTYFDRTTYLGAYWKDELIGFIRWVRVGNVAATLQVISLREHFDKKPTNALIAKAVEICEERGVSHFVYGRYVYNDPSSSLTEFKRRNGFEKMLVPRYYVPLTAKGRMALGLSVHHGLTDRIPAGTMQTLRKLRHRWHKYSLRFSTTTLHGNV